ncbi:M23 family metallopeptidase [Microbacterium jiangjiandongii]|uniref:M23 family metallopeptidase n=1 Tax=Microbacterium jiangjiandongii TaxID=3049071 RepID=UPI00214C3F2A|nr:M23 family metallopeptidase [Microbacterium sp. zg.Y843]MCR2815171.1 M23 family metallopeptidase [Microbacterium sp. zg.Y843]
MTLDAPTAVAAPLRRSSRTVITPAPQPEPALTRAELRRRAAQRADAQKAPVDEAPAADPAGDAAPSGRSSEVATADAAQTQAAELAVFMVAAAAAQLPVALANTAAVIGDVHDGAESSAAASTPTTCTVATVTAPSSRRARRAASRPSAPSAHTSAPNMAPEAPAVHVGDADRASDAGGASGSRELAADAFERAVQLFCSEGVAHAAPTAVAPQRPRPATVVDTVDAARAPRWASARRRLATASVSLGAMSVVGLLAVGLTTPAGALTTVADRTSGAAATTSLAAAASPAGEDEEIQAFVSSASTESVDLARSETYSTATMADLAAGSGVRNFDNSFLNNPNSPVQWPFPVGVPYTWGFQMRDGSMHHGVDFVPGAGAEIHSIADGTVRIATEAGGLFGVHVVVDHVIDGELVSSHYAHMEYGSLRVKVGDTVKVGDVLGTVGDTGYSFGAHLHFEVWQNGTTKVDPLEWMHEHTAG